MIFIETNSNSPYYNFAVEYYLMSRCRFPDDIVFMFWRTKPTVMIGKYQNTYSEINESYVNEHGINVVRRLSGGGTIYTDMGGWQFTFIVKTDSNRISFAEFMKPVVDALRGLGLNVSLSGRNDLVIDKRKFSGNAQHISRGYTLHHGSILFDTDIEQMVRCTTVDKYKIISKGIKSARDRVTNIADYFESRPTTEEFKQMMVHSITEGRDCEYHLTETEIAEIKEIATEKFNNWESKYGASPRCSMVQKKRFAGGGFECHIEVDKGLIERIKIFGDFFGTLDLGQLEQALRGCYYKRDNILEHIKKSYERGCIYRIEPEEIADAIVAAD